MPPKLPLPRGWKRRVQSSVLHILALSQYTSHLNLPDSTTNMPFLGRPISVESRAGAVASGRGESLLPAAFAEAAPVFLDTE